MATELRRAGVDNCEVQGWLGHRNRDMADRYAKFGPHSLSPVRAIIDAYFPGSGVKFEGVLAKGIENAEQEPGVERGNVSSRPAQDESTAEVMPEAGGSETEHEMFLRWKVVHFDQRRRAAEAELDALRYALERGVRRATRENRT